jgi:hypothetical protein
MYRTIPHTAESMGRFLTQLTVVNEGPTETYLTIL